MHLLDPRRVLRAGDLVAALARGRTVAVEARDAARIPRHGLLARLLGSAAKHHNVLGVLGTPDGLLLVPAANIVTDAGDTYYAQRGAAEAPTNAFGWGVQCSAGTPGKAAVYSGFTPIGSAGLAVDATYPRSNDPDINNTGRGVDIITWRYSYSAASFSGTVSHGLITVTSPIAGSPLLTGFAYGASFAKTTNDTLTVYVNHEMLGV
jgi:hypothetical protein